MCLTNDKGAYMHLYIFADPFIEEIASKTSVQPTTLLLWTAISEVRLALTLCACETEQNKKRVPLLHACTGHATAAPNWATSSIQCMLALHRRV